VTSPLVTLGNGPHARHPIAPLATLDTLWFQVGGTICNLTCTHCFISCSPANHSHEFLSLETVQRFLDEAVSLGVKEYYFTGGEPFMNRDMLAILEATLRAGPASVLTNGVLLKPELCGSLAALERASEYSLDVRISIDGWDAATNDPIRGEGTFDRILEGVKNLAGAGLNPVLTVTEACEGVASDEGRSRFLGVLRAAGLTRPRLKVLPLLRIGAEETRSRGYRDFETLEGRELAPAEAAVLQCSTSRMVTSKGVYVCPILIDHDRARMGSTLAETQRPFTLAFSACYTCWESGFSCRT
jgi:AdoMet-dependent heme synthase